MEQGDRPYRSVLYMPGSKPRALEKARTLPADAVIFDLEDSVLPTEKLRARQVVAETVAAGGFGGRRVLVRVNGLDTAWGPADIAAIARAKPDAILLPKVERDTDILQAAGLMERSGAPDAARIWAMMETPRAVLNAAAIASSHPRLEGFVMGTNDLVKDLGAAQRPDRLPILASLGLCLLAARAEGLVCVDGVFNAFQDLDGLRAACAQSRDLGFDGRTLIHPGQIAAANEIFAPTPSELAYAEEQLAAFEDARARGEGVAVLKGRIVENLHVAIARRMLARAAAIAALEAAAPAPQLRQGSGP